MEGIVFKFGNDINTDLIISGRYKFSITDPHELARHVFEDADPDFYKKTSGKNFFIAGGENFGCGSSREQAPQALKYAGCMAVLAKSFARIFYRNAFNLGLPLVECNTDFIKEGDFLILDIDKDVVLNKTSKARIEPRPFNNFQRLLIKEGGIINLYKKHGGLNIEF